MWSEVLAAFVTAVGCTLIWVLAGLLLVRLAGKVAVVDVMWGLGFVAVAVGCLIAATVRGVGEPARQWLLLAMVVLWGGRLAWHIGRRSVGKPEDPRYEELIERKTGSRARIVLTSVFVPQGLVLLVVSLPVQVGMVSDGGLGVLAALGVLCWAVGLFFEAVGDWQMERFKADPANKGRIADVGLWSYTRHPNYFGDAAVWVGIWLVVAERWPGVLTVVGPALMVWLLAFGTGKKLLERSMSKREGWDEYAARTSGFIPMPHALHRALTRR